MSQHFIACIPFCVKIATYPRFPSSYGVSERTVQDTSASIAHSKIHGLRQYQELSCWLSVHIGGVDTSLVLLKESWTLGSFFASCVVLTCVLNMGYYTLWATKVLILIVVVFLILVGFLLFDSDTYIFLLYGSFFFFFALSFMGQVCTCPFSLAYYVFVYMDRHTGSSSLLFYIIRLHSSGIIFYYPALYRVFK
jgi:hypothetical protein